MSLRSTPDDRVWKDWKPLARKPSFRSRDSWLTVARQGCSHNVYAIVSNQFRKKGLGLVSNDFCHGEVRGSTMQQDLKKRPPL